MNQIFRWLETWFGTFQAATTTAKPNFKNGFQVNGSDYTATELNSALGGGVPATAGTVTASKPVIVDANKDIVGFRDVQMRALDVGSSGTAANIDIFPTTASKGKFRLDCTDQTGDTIAAVNMGAQAAARTYGIPDWSTSASADTEGSLACIKVVADTTNRPGALGCLLYATGNNKLYVCTTASATAATWTVVGTQS